MDRSTVVALIGSFFILFLEGVSSPFPGFYAIAFFCAVFVVAFAPLARFSMNVVLGWVTGWGILTAFAAFVGGSVPSWWFLIHAAALMSLFTGFAYVVESQKE